MTGIAFRGIVMRLEHKPFGYVEIELDALGGKILFTLTTENYNQLVPLQLGSNINITLSKGERIQ